MNIFLTISSEAATWVFFEKELFLKVSQYLQENTWFESIFNKFTDLRHRCFLVNIAKFLRTPIMEAIWEWLFLKPSPLKPRWDNTKLFYTV